MIKVKICGLTRQQDAELACALGADAIGFIHERTSPRFIGDEIEPWMNRLPPLVLKVAVFGKVDRSPHKGVYDLVQGVEWNEFPESANTRIHVIRLRTGQKASDLTQQMVNASAILLDAYKEDAYGGTGHVVDWDLAAEIVQRAERPVILAGGLNPDNVAQAVRRVRPYAVDVSSGIEDRPGIKDSIKLRDFIQAAREA